MLIKLKTRLIFIFIHKWINLIQLFFEYLFIIVTHFEIQQNIDFQTILTKLSIISNIFGNIVKNFFITFIWTVY